MQASLFAICLLFVACKDAPLPPDGALCGTTTTDQQTIDCVVNTLNEALGCTQFVEDGAGRLINNYTKAAVDITFQDGMIGTSFEGYTDEKQGSCYTWRVRVQRGPTPWVQAAVLLHELGHTLGISFTDNQADPIHSPNEGDIMFHDSGAIMTKGTVATFVAQAEAKDSNSAIWMCGTPGNETISIQCSQQ